MAEIGYRLVRAREARGLTLEDAERDTRISRRYLEALEDEQFEVIPAPVYARGFLRSYAQYLGMDPQEMLDLFPRGDELRYNGTSTQPQASMTNPIPSTSPSRPSWRQPPRFDSGRGTRPDTRGRRRQQQAPAAPPAGEYVIGGPPATSTSRTGRQRSTPQLSRPGAPPRRPASRPTLGEPIIGQDIAPASARNRRERSASESQRNMIVIIGGVGIAIVVAVAAVLIATLGGGDDTPGGSTTNTPAGGGATTTTGTAETTATESATSATQPGVVPGVIGEPERDAIALIEAAGLQARVLRQQSAQARGTVIEQSPAPGIQRPAGSEVRIVVSEGQ